MAAKKLDGRTIRGKMHPSHKLSGETVEEQAARLLNAEEAAYFFEQRGKMHAARKANEDADAAQWREAFPGAMVKVRCVCSNAHLGDGRVLYDGDQAEVPQSLADLLIGKGMAVYD